MNAPDPLARVATLRIQMAGAGFRPVALKTGDKMPLIREWQERARRNPPADAEEAPRMDHLNTGLLCDELRVLDLDVDDAELIGRLKALAVLMLGETICRSRANSPRCALLYRASVGSPKKLVASGTVGKVEVLGHGQQLHAFGRHPSGVDLQWHPEPPGQITRENLPAVTEEAVRAFLAAAAPLIGAEIPAENKNVQLHCSSQQTEQVCMELFL